MLQALDADDAPLLDGQRNAGTAWALTCADRTLCRIRGMPRVTPSIAVEVATSQWDLSEILEKACL